MSSAGEIEWKYGTFDTLDAATLYAVLQLRSEVFVVEQACVFLDPDGADEQAIHLRGYANGKLAAYARCFGPGVKFDEASIGRVVTAASARSSGLGHKLIEQAIDCVHRCWGAQAIRIGAQARLRQFYASHGFADVGVPYVEDGIDHLEMVLQTRGHAHAC